MLRSQFSMASFAFCVAFVTIASAMSSIAVATEAGDWYLMTLYLGSSDTHFFRKKVRLAVSKTIAESDQLRPTNSLPFIMQESGAKRPAKLLQRNSTEENDRADTSSDACQVGDADGDVPAHPSKTTELAQTPESSQETAICTYT